MLRSLGHIVSLVLLIIASTGHLPGNANAATEPDQPGFFRFPAISGDWVVFTSEGDLWKVPVTGGTALRLTTHEGEEKYAKFSPDGKWVAFTGQEDGQDDVFLIPSSGGEPRRLTYHPHTDQSIGWDLSGNILFRSTREIPYRGFRVYRVAPEGGIAASIGLDKAALVTFEPGGKRIAFNPLTLENHRWKRYQGGMAMTIWVGDLGVPEFTDVTGKGAAFKDWKGDYGFPMWHKGGRIYFLSNRDGRANIHSMNPDGNAPKQHTFHKEFDARFPSMGGDRIVYQLGMDLRLYDLAKNEDRAIPIALPTDRLQARVKYFQPGDFITDYDLGPDAKRIILSARGEIVTAPAKGEGLIRQLTYSAGSREKYPRWSPDGKSIAAWTDASGEEVLHLYPAEGGTSKVLGTDSRGWHFPPVWSPDGKKVLFGNEECELIVMSIPDGKTSVIDKSTWEISQYRWSPDSRFVAYARAERNYNSIIQIWDSVTGKSTPVTDDFVSSHSPAWSTDGKYLFLLSDREANPVLDGMEMTYILDRRTKIYAYCLKKGTPSPFAPEVDPRSDDDEGWGGRKESKDSGKGKGKDKEKDKDKKDSVKVEIDFDGLASRVAVFPIPAGNYGALEATEEKVFYLAWERQGMLGSGLFDDDRLGRYDLHRFDLKKKKDKVAVEGIDSYDLAIGGKKLVYRQKGEFTLMGVDEEGSDGGGGGRGGRGDKEDSKKVELGGWEMRLDVRAEWQQIFDEAWRLQRDFFWDPNMHGVDWKAIRAKYRPLAARISTRGELNDLIGELFAELNCSHTYVWGGDVKGAKHRPSGLLGIDASRDATGFIRIDQVITGRPWEPNATSPLAAPGIDAKAGEYIVAINGRSTNSVPDYFELLLGTADRITQISLNSTPSLDAARNVVVKPLASEAALRYNDWVDGRKRYVEEKSGGKIGYIHLTNMGGAGLSQFTAGYQPQHTKQALIMDVRYNGGGFVAEMILAHLDRNLVSAGMARHGLRYRSPSTAFYGHLAAVSNGETGSDGETFTEGFKRLKLGPVIGTRTWGGWVGIRGDKPLVDRGMVTQPEFTGWGVSDRKWLIEGWGTDPDIEVVDDPASTMQGKDPSLDYTIKYLLDKIEKEPMTVPDMPEFPKDRGYRK